MVKDDELQNLAQEPQKTTALLSVTTLPLTEIMERPMGDTRALNLKHTFELALSIEQVGLIEPIVIDQECALLAGGHRLAALKLLNPLTRSSLVQRLLMNALQQFGEEGLNNIHRQLDELRAELPATSTIDFEEIPVRVFPFSSRESPHLALEVEVSENAQRRDYAPEEVLALYQTLLAKGYTDPKGRPKAGERAVKPVIATIIGQSVRTVRRKLEQAEALERATEAELLRAEALKLIKSVQRLKRQLTQLTPQVASAVRSSIEWREAYEGLSKALSTIEEAPEPSEEPAEEATEEVK